MKIDEFTKRHQLVYDMLNNDQYSEIKIMLSKNAKNIGVETEIVFTDFFGQSHTFINKKLDKKRIYGMEHQNMVILLSPISMEIFLARFQLELSYIK